MNLLPRSSAKCAKFYNGLLLACLLSVVPWGPVILIPVLLLLMGLAGIAAYQAGWRPLFAGILAISIGIPYLGVAVLFAVLVGVRYHLQNQNYIVSFFGARESGCLRPARPKISWRRQFRWLAVFFAIPLFIFAVLWLLNSPYEGKFFQPVAGHPWLALGLLMTAFLLPILTVPVGIEIDRIRAMRTPGDGARMQIVLLNALCILFCTISVLIIVLSPAALTMVEQMRLWP